MGNLWFLGIGAFLLGSIPFGRLVGYFAGHIDVRKAGSGNIGATNVARQLGIGWGLLTLVLDMLKGFLPVAAAQRLVSGDAAVYAGITVGLAALLGHQFSVFQRFAGGKGVATALGVFLALSPVACLTGLGIFVVLVLKWRYISLGSLAAAASVPITLHLQDFHLSVVLGAVIGAALIFFRHRQNILRLIRGREPKWGQKISGELL